METKTDHFTISPDRELGEDEFWAERQKLKAEDWELVGTFECTEAGKLRYESQVRSLERQGFTLRTLRKSGSMQILKKELDPNEEAKVISLDRPKIEATLEQIA